MGLPHPNGFSSLKSKSGPIRGIFRLGSSLAQASYSAVTSAAGHRMLLLVPRAPKKGSSKFYNLP